MREPQLSNAALATRATAGDAEALGRLLERYRPSLYAAAIDLLRNREEARDAVQETCVVALVRIGSLRDAAAVGGWLHRVLRNICLMRLRSRRHTTPHSDADVRELAPSMDEALERLALRDWVWTAIEELTPEDRVTVMLRHFTRSSSYEAIASVTGAPVGTVRSRLNRARALLATALQREAADSLVSRDQLERNRRAEWEAFYAELHEKPVPRTYRASYSPDIEVTDRNGRWQGVREWSDHERKAIVLGVRARIVDLVASRDITVIEIDFTNPDWASDHCPPRSTFVHRLAGGRSRRLDIHYV
jgi:RNA polymerase sigma factor (sigma-70 family)